MELEQAVRLSPPASLQYFLLGQAYLQLEDYAKAKTNYEKAALLQPDDSRAYYGLATACDKLGESDKAKEYQEKFRKLKAGESVAFYRELNRYDDLVGLRQRVVLAHLAPARCTASQAAVPRPRSTGGERQRSALRIRSCSANWQSCTRARTGEKMPL